MNGQESKSVKMDELPEFDPKTAKTETFYKWSELSDEKIVMVLRPIHANSLGILTDVFALEGDRLREVNGREMFLADDSGDYFMAEHIPMGHYSPEVLQVIADEYARAAAFLRSITED
ncbi:hypothetical protein PV439_11375 [Streptomyces scabiei]|uniref:hypothetical protein n=1 Tax=Streptomyces scabiei TaxID=1930 RepID=UPI00299FABF8|nr:hypothetical protein [Streptomyces scabiei]MDX2891943.1 hypothetical protein [Streptomyces scabiei]MDX2900148.1 hypothetical protein [Streptomyces scabiei]